MELFNGFGCGGQGLDNLPQQGAKEFSIFCVVDGHAYYWLQLLLEKLSSSLPAPIRLIPAMNIVNKQLSNAENEGVHDQLKNN